MHTINLPEFSYINGQSKFPFNIDKLVKSTIKSNVDFINIILHNIKYNIDKKIKITTFDVNSFTFDQEFYEDHIDEEILDSSNIISETISTINQYDIKMIFIIEKEYFLGSQSNDVVEGTKKLLKKLSDILDLFGATYPSIIIRIGSAYGNRKSTMKTFCNNANSLESQIKNKLCVMNDDKPSLFSVTDLLSGIYYETQIPICFRFLGHNFNNGNLSIREALFLAYSTWKHKDKPIFIYGESSEVDESGISKSTSVSHYIKNRIPTFGLFLDIIIDASSGEKALIKYRSEYKSLFPIIINKIKK